METSNNESKLSNPENNLNKHDEESTDNEEESTDNEEESTDNEEESIDNEEESTDNDESIVDEEESTDNDESIVDKEESTDNDESIVDEESNEEESDNESNNDEEESNGDKIDPNDIWYVLDNYFSDKRRLIKHHIDSFNNFLEHLIPQTLSENGPHIVYYNFNEKKSKYMSEIHISFQEPQISKPVINEHDIGKIKPMYPNDARLRNLTYCGTLSCTIIAETYKYVDDEKKLEKTNEYKNIILGKLPIMIGSKYCILNEISSNTRSEMGECINDEGGYFIVKGSEKVIIPQEAKCPNKIYIFPTTKNLSKFSKIAEITSIKKNNLSMIKPLQVKLYNLCLDRLEI